MECLLLKKTEKTKAGHMPSKAISIHMCCKVIETALNWHGEPTGDGPDPRQVGPIFRLNDLNANAFYKEGLSTSKQQLHDTLPWQPAPRCSIPTGKLHMSFDGNRWHIGKKIKASDRRGWSMDGVSR